MKEYPIKVPKEEVEGVECLSASDTGVTDEEIKDHGAVFTPTKLVQKMLDELDYDWNNHDHTKTWLDPTGGNGQFIAELARRGIKPENIYSADLLEINVESMKKRLKEIFLSQNYDDDYIDFHLERNIVQADALKFNYNFHEKADLEEEW